MKKKVLIGSRERSRSPEAMEILNAQGYELIVNPHDRALTENELLEMIKGVEGMIAGSEIVTAAVIAAGAPTLKVIAKQGVGYNTINVDAAKEHGVAVTITPGANSKSVADLALGLMMAIARQIPQMDSSIRKGEWYRHTGVELRGKVLGIIGMGNIGGEVAKRAYGFGMKIIAYDVYPRQEFIDNYGVTYLSLDEVFSEADFISLHAPAMLETAGMVNMDRLRKMKKTSYIINTARGELIVEDDLYKALKEGIIAGAALDVFAQEPPQNSPLMELKNVVFTSHAGAYTNEAIVGAGVMAAEEIVRVLSGSEAKYSVVK
ncbi:phosphoglycerate dehydrogenase [Pelosinus propionicus]|uniref:2-oxoglutarate reductase n=1 Tax=Pelosinus propionicus DSM 13327 TaxID=1123291 RepID=A0A1I4H0G8_9FIRM|nr:phosphoglycerate dehydrogenase [Pelosinus propionicus]SFL35280.1 D-3-phosphoglycerate dehydrogenase [Pelosinus propionicus DSM 13327]